MQGMFCDLQEPAVAEHGVDGGYEEEKITSGKVCRLRNINQIY